MSISNSAHFKLTKTAVGGSTDYWARQPPEGSFDRP